MAAVHNLKILGVIPARYESSRLPGKALRPIAGRAMIHHVYARAQRCPLLSDLRVATDSELIRAYCEKEGLKVMITSREHVSGTDRVHEVSGKLEADVYANIQGDEPMVTPHHLELLLRPFFEDPAVQVTTLKTPLGAQQARDPNAVKVVTDPAGRALYFSRAPIPYHREGSERPAYFKHLGFYAYRRAALERFHALSPSPLERAERLEQLRFLENGISILVLETPHDTLGVDTEEDLEKVEGYFAQTGSAD